MRFLIVGVSLLFSFIFYVFYTANLGKNIFFQDSEYVFYGKTLLWSFMYFPIIFLCLAVFFFYIFQSKNKEVFHSYNEEVEDDEDFEYEADNQIGPVQENYSKKIWLYIFIQIILVGIFYFLEIHFFFLLTLFNTCIFVHFLFSNLYYKGKIPSNIYVNGNIFSIIFAYWFSLLSIIFIFFHPDFQLFDTLDRLLFYIWNILMCCFHIYIHTRYTNIISLLFWVIVGIYSLYSIIITLFSWII